MTEKVEIVGHEFEVTDRIHEYVTKKVAKLDRYMSSVEDMRIELSHTPSARSATDRYAAELTVRGKGYILRAEERAADVRAAVDAATDKMQRQMVRYKDKHYGRARAAGAAEAEGPALEAMEDAQAGEEQAAVIGRRKEFDLIPMDEMEAIEQMKLLGHDNFFIFYNIKSERINVLYRRRDGTYGLIEPQVR